MINEMNECMEKVMIGKIKEWLGDEEYVYDIYDYEIEFKKRGEIELWKWWVEVNQLWWWMETR